LQSHYLDWPTEDVHDWRKTKNFMLKILEESGLLEEGDPEDDIGNRGDFVLHLISKIESNGFGLWSPKKGVCMGRAIFPRASYFNHSCDPNCECIQDGMIMTIRTKRPVEEGEASLTISYIDTNLPLGARRARLQEEYFFTCGCERCNAESNGTAPARKL
ncbi:hypothetical protein BDK51DRAFT_11615, partial [Blyttiomyces helicus]